MKNSFLKNSFFVVVILLLLVGYFNVFSQKTNGVQERETVNNKYKKVLQHMGEGKYPDAINLLKTIIKENPTFLRATTKIVEAYGMKKELDAALVYFTGMKNRNPGDFIAYYGLGWVYRSMKKYDEAVEQFEKSIDLRPDFPEPYLGLVGSDLRRRKKNKTAVSDVETFLKGQIRKNPDNACAYFGLGAQYENERRWEESLVLLDQALKIDPNLWIVFASKATVYYYLGEYRKVLACLNVELEFASKNGDIERKRRVLGNMGIIHRNLGNYQEALSLNNRALRICRNTGDRKNEGRHLTNISNIHMDLGDYENALMLFRTALALNRETGNNWSEAITLANIGDIYYAMGDYKRSIHYYENAQEINARVGNRQREGRNLERLGNISIKMGDHPKAISYFEEALAVNRKTGDKKGEVKTLRNIGTVYRSLGNFSEALRYYEKALGIVRDIGQKFQKRIVLNLMGDLFLKQKNFSMAMEFFNKALAVAEDTGIAAVNWESLYGLALVYQAQERYEQALKAYKKSIEVIEGTRSRLQLEEHRSGFLKDKVKVYESLVNLLYVMHQKNPSGSFIREALYTVEKAKARAFFDSLQEARIDLKMELSAEIKEKEYKINRKISRLQTDLLKPDLNEKKRNEILFQLEKIEEKYQNLILTIKKENPGYAGLVYPEPYRIKDIQEQLLTEDLAVVEYFLGEEYSFVFLITRTELEILKIPSATVLNESVYAYLKLLSSKSQKTFRGVAASRHLYDRLVSPFRGNMKGIRDLIVIPDGNLHYLPFETLAVKNEEKEAKVQYLIENFRISYAPSASSLIDLLSRKGARKAPKDFLAFADPVYTIGKASESVADAERNLREFYMEKGFRFTALKYSREEVKRIGKRIPEPFRDLYIGDRAREEVVKRLPLGDYNVVHFATHGWIDEDVIGRSGLVLTLDDDPAEDGFFQVREIYGIRMHADLVVLSACQTGKGKLEKGEGVSGLSRAFLFAGADSVVVSLWNIDDRSTAIFMDHFYNYLIRGEGKAQALRLAKLDMLDSKYNRPYFWAAFVLIGDARSPVNLSKSEN